MKNYKIFIPAVLWFFVVLILICLPGSAFPKHSPFLEKIYFDKWVHAGMFGLLTLLWLFPLIKIILNKNLALQWAYKICTALVVWGITTEFIQKFFIVNRAFDIWDWAADSFGVLCAFIIWKKIRYQSAL